MTYYPRLANAAVTLLATISRNTRVGIVHSISPPPDGHPSGAASVGSKWQQFL